MLCINVHAIATRQKHHMEKPSNRLVATLASTRDQGLRIIPEGDRFECHVDASHACDWKQATAIDDPDMARSRTGYVLSYAKCPLV
jgi:hypothetical protein